MVRRILSSLTILAGVFILGTLVWVYAASRHPGAPAGPPQGWHTGEDAATAPPCQGPPQHVAFSPFRANTLVARPFPDHPDLSATLVSFDVDAGSAALALGRLSDASGMSIDPLPEQVPPDAGIAADAPVSLHLVDQPLMEALMEIQAQAPVTIIAVQANAQPARGNALVQGPLTARYETRRTVPLMWSVAGPFAFGLESMYHGMQVNDDGTVHPAAVRMLHGGSPPADAVVMRFHAYIEPRIKILTYPQFIDVRAAVDDRGNSLLPPPDHAGRPLAQPNTANMALEAALAYPENNPGRTLKAFSATARFTIQTADELPTITLDDPLHTLPVTREFQGMQITFDKATWNKAEQGFDMSVTYDRGTYKGDWASFVQAAGGIKPRATQSTGRDVVSRAFSSTPRGDSVVVTYGIQLAMILRSGGGGIQRVPQSDTPPPVANFIFDMPVGSVALDVPVDFKDLPLP